MSTDYPGVFVDEVPTRIHPIEGVSTSTAGFVAVTKEGARDHAVSIKNFAEFEEQFGTTHDFPFEAVRLFFENGGKRLYIARVSFEGSSASEVDYKKAFALLDEIKDISLIAVPGFASPSLASFGAEYCSQRRDCFFIADMTAKENTRERAEAFVNSMTTRNSYAAIYFPWLKVADGDDFKNVPPSGAVAGIYARTDASRGVWGVPSGEKANISGAVGLAAEITDADQEALNSIGINVNRSIPGKGVVLWGARTVGTLSDPDFKYVSVRRLLIYIEESIKRGLQWTVFEENGDQLWANVRRSVEDFLFQLFQVGAFQGSKPEQAFFVKCDRSTMTQADIDNGRLIVLIGIATVRPAEFVIIRIGQWVGTQVEPKKRVRRGCLANLLGAPVALLPFVLTKLRG